MTYPDIGVIVEFIGMEEYVEGGKGRCLRWSDKGLVMVRRRWLDVGVCWKRRVN